MVVEISAQAGGAAAGEGGGAAAGVGGGVEGPVGRRRWLVLAAALL